jgi:radical SAM protein with 4Fe4S-binding SPASM domain
VNTLVCEETIDDVPAIHDLVVAMGAARWSLFFLVGVGRGQVLQPIAPGCAERLLVWLARQSAPPRPGGPVITTTEAPHFRRVVAELRRDAGVQSTRPVASTESKVRIGLGAGIRDGNGILFISHTGEICPSGFLEISVGNVRRDDVATLYREAPLFRALRNPDEFAGRCGRCEYRWACGGSRARAYSTSHDPLGEDPLCEHETQVAAVHHGH